MKVLAQTVSGIILPVDWRRLDEVPAPGRVTARGLVTLHEMLDRSAVIRRVLSLCGPDGRPLRVSAGRGETITIRRPRMG